MGEGVPHARVEQSGLLVPAPGSLFASLLLFAPSDFNVPLGLAVAARRKLELF